MSNAFVRGRDNQTNKHQTFTDGVTVRGGASIDVLTVVKTVVSVTEGTSSFSAVAGLEYMVDTSVGGAAVTVTLPASADCEAGDRIVLYDAGGSFDSYNLILGRNGSKINGVAADVTVDLAGVKVTLIYRNTTYGWYLHVA